MSDLSTQSSRTSDDLPERDRELEERLRQLFDKTADAFSGGMVDYRDRVSMALVAVYEFGVRHGRAARSESGQSQASRTSVEKAIEAWRILLNGDRVTPEVYKMHANELCDLALRGICSERTSRTFDVNALARYAPVVTLGLPGMRQDDVRGQWVMLADVIALLTLSESELHKDAARYRHLREHDDFAYWLLEELQRESYIELALWQRDLDESIDRDIATRYER